MYDKCRFYNTVVSLCTHYISETSICHEVYPLSGTPSLYCQNVQWDYRNFFVT